MSENFETKEKGRFLGLSTKKDRCKKNKGSRGNKGNDWKTSSLLRTCLALALCIAMVAGAFAGIDLVEQIYIIRNLQSRSISTEHSFTHSDDFNQTMDGYLQLLELHMDISRRIAPQGTVDYDTVILKGEDRDYTLKELCARKGSGYDYASYVQNYINGLKGYNASGVSLLELTKNIRALDDMVVLEKNQIYRTPAASEKLSEKDWKKLGKEQKTGSVRGYEGDETRLPAFEEEWEEEDTSDGMESICLLDREEKVPVETSVEKWLFAQYPAYAEAYMEKKIATSKDSLLQSDSGETSDFSVYQEILQKNYKKDCYLAKGSAFYEQEYIMNEDGSVSTRIRFYNEKTKKSEIVSVAGEDEEKVFYLKNGRKVTAQEVTGTPRYQDKNIYSESMESYAKRLLEDAEQKIEELSQEEKPWSEDKPWSVEMIPYSMKTAVDYAQFLVSTFETLSGVFQNNNPFGFYFETGDTVLFSANAWKNLAAKIKAGELDDTGTKEEQTDYYYGYYNSNGEVFRSNLMREDFDYCGYLEDYLKELGSLRGATSNYICMVGIDMQRVRSGNDKGIFSQLYQEYLEQRDQYESAENDRKDTAKKMGADAVSVLLLLFFLTIMSGHEKEKAGISLLRIDRIGWELLLLAGGCLVLAFICILDEVWNNVVYYYDYVGEVHWVAGYDRNLFAWILSAIALVLCAFFMSMVKRVKAKALVSTSIFCRLWKYGKKKSGSVRKWLGQINEWGKELPAWKRYILVLVINLVGGIFGICVVIGSYGYMDDDYLILVCLDAFFLIGVDGYCFVKSLKNALADERIRQGAQRIAQGELSYQIQAPEGISKEQAGLIEVINHIGEGLEKAVEESVRSERMKAELITNVSHDIKTPLTSVINYVDLLKREHIEGERAQEYLQVMEQKSQRLKVLIEDLVEASKASSGALELQITQLNFNELVHQTDGEFEGKFEQAGLQLMENVPQEPVLFRGDGRRVYRILENLYGNVAKYAMPGTRVYTELSQKQDRVVFAIKNISKEPLNISAEELTERFVRGEQSRTTEGSGLGLSIAKNLTELMGGQFSIYLDGDLFRVTIEFPLQ